MEDKLGQLLQMYQAWIALAQEARNLATDEVRVKPDAKAETTDGTKNGTQVETKPDVTALALMGYYTAIAEVWESAAGDLLQWIEAVEKARDQRRY